MGGGMTAAVTRTVDSFRSILRNALALLGAYALPRVFTIGAIIVAARTVGTERFGVYGTAAGFAVLLSVASTLGMLPLLTRDISRDASHAGELLAAAHRIKTVSNIVMLLALLVIARWVLHYPDDLQACALLLGLAYAVGSYSENFAAYYQAVERMHVWTQASACFGLVSGGLGAILAVQTRNIIWFSAAPLAGQVITLAYLYWRLPQLPHVRASGHAMSQLLRSLAPFAAAFVALTVYSKIDVVLLRETADAVQVGLYTAAYKFVDIAQALTIVAVAAVYPRLARKAEPAQGERWAGARVVELMLIATTVGAGLLWLLREQVIHVLYGAEFAPAVTALAFLAAALVPLVANICAAYVLALRERMRQVALAYSGAALLSIALNLSFTPHYGAAGAAVSKLGAESVLAGSLLLMLHLGEAAAPARRVVLRVATLPPLCAALAFVPDFTGGWLRAAVLLAFSAIIFASSGALARHEISALRYVLRRKQSTIAEPSAS